ncbi:histidine phosphatase family protein [Corynebacterium cystitidis]|uniref:histidine phosphatase family protein n=1 Tax=Corynebacterium cystitidis TaxID=35757 RepID=UPI00211F14FF|nr:histidine phosphatase family protein [Corynebacterium cystitidis]
MLILLRHGQTTSNVGRALDTALPGAPLTELGQQQAREVGPELMDLYNPELVVTSEALRARQTGQLAFGSHFDDIPAVAGLQEITAGDHEMLSTPEAHEAYHGTVHSWFGGDSDAAIPGGEDAHQFLDRYRGGVAEALRGGHASAVVVSHGAAIRMFAVRAAGIDPQFAVHNPLPNCRFVVLHPTATFGQWELVRWGDHS